MVHFGNVTSNMENDDNAEQDCVNGNQVFKRICREHEIFRWPTREARHDDGPSNIPQNFVQPREEMIKDSGMKKLPVPVQPVEQYLNSKPDSTENAMTVQNDSSITVKVTYRDNMIRFDLSLPLGKMALEEEIAKRFHLSTGSFYVKYLDDDEDWILVTCDADLKICVTIMKRSGKNRIKMLVNPSQVN